VPVSSPWLARLRQRKSWLGGDAMTPGATVSLVTRLIGFLVNDQLLGITPVAVL